ncbi:DUF6328 family protein [Rhodococcus sp. NPDC058505]|uniref:DUF6328 family protein n=1 Tax=unclassified Rhodococcus (in: high G+C Gram-positive bacteria) TaxID=192944 RepID=UPI00366860A1
MSAGSADAAGAPVDHPERDGGWDRAARNETPTEQLDRNWASLLQELRVTQTGVQLLTGFLLILPFQSTFDRLSDFERGVYLAAVLSAVASTVLLAAPVGMHRILFRQHKLQPLVAAAHRCALAGVVLLGLALTCVVILTVGVVLNVAWGVVAGAAVASLFAFVGLIWPWWLRRRS